MKKIVILLVVCVFGIFRLEAKTDPTVILYHRILNDRESYPELMLNSTVAEYTSDGLKVTGKEGWLVIITLLYRQEDNHRTLSVQQVQ